MAASSSPLTSEEDVLIQNGDIEIETVDEETFDILDDATDLGTLAFEFSETKKNLALRKNNGRYVPQDLFRWGTSSITVSDISSGLWCELQVEYRYLHPYLMTTPEWSRRSAEGRPVERRTKHMIQGSAIHFKKEIEIRKPVDVETVTKEDRCAVELVNTFIKLQSVAMGNTEREIKLFGRMPGGNQHNLLVSGVIDQVQYCVSDNSLIVLELKTRKSQSLPENEQRKANHLQVMIYKVLLDSFTHGLEDYTQLLQARGLLIDRPLTAGPVEHMKELKLDNSDQLTTPPTLRHLADTVSKAVVNLNLPLVDALLVQYVYQGNGDVLGVEPVPHDDEWVRKMVDSAHQYWKGERDATGVDIEECWKCSTCPFKDVCVWRKKQKLETSPVKKWPEEFYQPSPKRIAL